MTSTTTAPAAAFAPRYALLWALLTYVLCTLILAYPALTGGFLVTPVSDQYIGGFPVRDFAAQSLKAGEGIPQWNPYIFGGLPYIAAMHGDIFYPTFVLRALLPTDVAMTWSFIIHVVLAGVFTYLFARSAGLGFFSSLVGGIAYLMSGPIAGLVSPGHDGKLYVSALLPLVLFFLVHGIRDGRWWAWGGLAIAVGLAVLSPHPQLLQYLLLVAGFFALYLAFGSWDERKLDRSVAVRRLGLALAAVGVGFMMGAIQYAPVLDYVAWSPRSGGKDYAHAISYSLPTEELLNAVVPEFSGILDRYWGRNGIHFHSEYAGVVTLILAGLGLTAAPPRGRGFRWFWVGAFVVSLLWALGGSTPFYQLIYHLVPGTKYFRAPSTMMYVTMFSVAVFAALGVERALRATATIGNRFLLGWLIGFVALGLLMAAGLPQAVASSIGRSAAQAPEQIPGAIDYFQGRARESQPQLLGGIMRSAFFAFATLGLLWMFRQGRAGARNAAIALAALMVADLWSVERRYWRFSEPAAVTYGADAAITALRADTVPGRVLTWDPFRSATYHDPFVNGDALMVHGIRQAMGYHGNELGRYQSLYQSAWDPALEGPMRPEFWRHQNVRYLYTTLADSLTGAVSARVGGPLTKVAGPVRNAAGTIVYLYRLPGENPAAWVASAFVKGTDEQALATVLDSRFEPTRAAIVDTAETIDVAGLNNVPGPAGVGARIARLQAGRIDVTLDAPAPAGAGLVVSENYYPGWTATVDGNSARAVRANYNLIAVPLPQGAREVQLRFADPAYPLGKALTLVAVILSVVAVGAGWWVERRRTAIASHG